MCLVAFQKIFRKIFSDVWKRRRKRQTQEKYHQRSRSEIAISSVRSRDQRCDLAINGASSQRRDLAIDASRDHDLGRRRDRNQLRDLAMARSREGEITIDASRDRVVDRDLRSDRRTGARKIGAAWSSESAGDRRTDWNVSSSLARARSLSLSFFFRKYFEVKMRGENHFQVKGENTSQPEVIFRKISFSVTTDRKSVV